MKQITFCRKPKEFVTVNTVHVVPVWSSASFQGKCRVQLRARISAYALFLAPAWGSSDPSPLPCTLSLPLQGFYYWLNCNHSKSFQEKNTATPKGNEKSQCLVKRPGISLCIGILSSETFPQVCFYVNPTVWAGQLKPFKIAYKLHLWHLRLGDYHLASCNNIFSSIIFTIIPSPNSLHSDLPPWQTTALCVKAQGSASCHSEGRTRGGNRQPIDTAEGGSSPRAQTKCPLNASWLPRVPDDHNGQLAFSNVIPWSDLHRLISMQVPSLIPPKHSRR